MTGPTATNVKVLPGNYHGVITNLITILESLSGAMKTQSQNQYRPGTLPDRANANPQEGGGSPNAGNSDAIIVVLGISGLSEEEGESIASPRPLEIGWIMTYHQTRLSNT